MSVLRRNVSAGCLRALESTGKFSLRPEAWRAGPMHMLDTVGDESVCKTQAVRERKILNCEEKREGGKRNEKETHNLNFA